MEPEKFDRLRDLIEDIKKVDAMILLHTSNPSKTMYEQYLAKKVKLTGFLIDELLSPELRSEQSLSLIWEALARFYPHLQGQQIQGNISGFGELQTALAS